MSRILYPSLQSPITIGDDPTNVARYYKQWEDPYSDLNRRKAAVTQMASGQTLDPFPRFTPEFIGPDKWWQPFSERLYAKPGLRADLQQVSAYSESAQFPETTSIDRYLYPFSLPVWQKPRLIAAANPFVFFHSSPQDLNNVAWWRPFSEPKRFPKRLDPGLQPASFPESRPIISIGWYMALSEPKRFKARLIESDQPFYWSDEEPPEFDAMPWYAPFSEPKRFKPELNKALNPDFVRGLYALGTPYGRGYVIC